MKSRAHLIVLCLLAIQVFTFANCKENGVKPKASKATKGEQAKPEKLLQERPAPKEKVETMENATLEAKKSASGNDSVQDFGGDAGSGTEEARDTGNTEPAFVPDHDPAGPSLHSGMENASASGAESDLKNSSASGSGAGSESRSNSSSKNGTASRSEADLNSDSASGSGSGLNPEVEEASASGSGSGDESGLINGSVSGSGSGAESGSNPGVEDASVSGSGSGLNAGLEDGPGSGSGAGSGFGNVSSSDSATSTKPYPEPGSSPGSGFQQPCNCSSSNVSSSSSSEEEVIILDPTTDSPEPDEKMTTAPGFDDDTKEGGEVTENIEIAAQVSPDDVCVETMMKFGDAVQKFYVCAPKRSFEVEHSKDVMRKCSNDNDCSTDELCVSAHIRMPEFAATIKVCASPVPTMGYPILEWCMINDETNSAVPKSPLGPLERRAARQGARLPAFFPRMSRGVDSVTNSGDYHQPQSNGTHVCLNGKLKLGNDVSGIRLCTDKLSSGNIPELLHNDDINGIYVQCGGIGASCPDPMHDCRSVSVMLSKCTVMFLHICFPQPIGSQIPPIPTESLRFVHPLARYGM